MSKPLLLDSSACFEHSDIISNIHQSMIDLNGEEDEELIQSLLIEALKYLDQDLNQKLANELFPLIEACFIRYPSKFLNILNDLLAKSRNNSNYIIVTAYVISSLSHIEPNLNLPDYSKFVNEALDEIFNQIKNSEIESITIFGKKILPKFKYDLVINLLLSSKLTKDLLTNFLPFVFSQDIYTKNPRFAKLVTEIVKNEFISFLSPTIITDKDLYARLSTEILSYFIPLLSDQIFSQIFPEFVRTFCEELTLNSLFILNLLDRSDKLNMKLNKIERVFDFLKPEDFTSNVIQQLKKYDFVIPNEYGSHFTDSDIMNITSDTFVHFKESSENSKEKIEFDDMTILSLKKLFEEGKSNEIIEKVIFKNYPPRKENVTFLLNFIKSLGTFQLESFYSIEKNRPILLKIQEKKIFPPPSLLNIIDIKTVIETFQSDKSYQNDLLLLYCYAFCREEKDYVYEKTLDQVIILPPKNETNILHFIESNEFELLNEFNDKESLLFIICAILYANKKVKKVCELTKDFVLPFFAIALNNIKNKDSIDHLLELTDIKDTIREGCILIGKNNESKILNASIDSIISKINENDDFLSSEFPLIIIDPLIDLLIKNEYRANKSNLYKLLFNLTNKQPKKLQNKHGNKIIDSIINDINHISNFRNETKLNLKDFESNEITNLFLQKLQNQSSSKDEIFNTIDFIQNFIINPPTLKIDNCENIQKVCQEIIKTNKWDELFIVYKFMVNNNILKEYRQELKNQIPSDLLSQFYSIIPFEERTIDEFLTIILSTQNIETNDSIIEDLFNKLISNESITIEYLKIIINLHFNAHLETKTLLKRKMSVYNKYGDLFIKAFDCIRVYNPAAAYFIPRHEYEYKTFSNPDFVEELISKLLKIVTEEPDKYQAFFILKNLASTFPFFFDQNPEQVFNSVLPVFDNYSLVCNEKINDELEINKIKSLITAISFIISAVHSTSVIDSFCIWIFQNIEKFTNSQIICFNYIILSILNTNVKCIFMIFIDKNMNIIQKLLKKDDFQDEKLREHYFSVLYSILANIYNFKKMDTRDWLLKDEISSKNRPFYYYKCYHSTIYFTTIDDYEITCNNNEIIKKFNENIFKKRPFWISSYSNGDDVTIISEQVENFMNRYKKIVKLEEPFDELPEVSYGYVKTEEMVRYAIRQNMWIYNYFFYFDCHSLLPRYQKIVVDVQKTLNDIRGRASRNDFSKDVRYYDINSSLFQKPYTSNKELFELICQKVTSLTNKNQSKLYTLISVVSRYELFYCSLFENLFNFLKKIEHDDDNGSIKLTTFDVCLLALRNEYLTEYTYIFYYKNMMKKLVEMSLQPQYRTNDNFLLQLSQLFSIYDKYKLDIKITHIIGFMLLSKNDEVIRKAIYLCSKFSELSLYHLSIIQEVFDRELSKEKFNPLILNDFCNFYPQPILPRKTETLNFLRKLFEIYQDRTIGDNYKNTIGELIISIMNILSPVRESLNSFSMSDSSTINMKAGKQKFSFQPIPRFVWDSNPFYWKLFDENRSIINEIIEKQREIVSSFKVFTEFPELFDFKLRMKYFRDKINDFIKDDTNYLTVERDDILQTTFDQIKENIYDNSEYNKEEEEEDNDDDDDDDDRKDKKWLNEFDITFTGEDGIDSGGLTRDWFTNLLKSIFDPENDLFVPRDKGSCYQPKSNSIKDNEFFKFVGQVVARAIVEGLCIGVQLSLPFVKQILHRKICFKDLQNYDASLYNSFQSILDTDIDNDPNSEYYFEVTAIDSNGMETVPLKPNGKNIRVTNANKQEFVNLITNYYLKESIKEQIEAFSNGFDSIIPHKEARIFTASEFEILLCGVPEIDPIDLRKNFIYENGYNENTPAVVLFFKAISKWSQENLAKLLLFFTGTCNVSADGYTKEKLIISYGGERDKFPVAHTCSNKLDLPKYETEEELNEKFMLAINIEDFNIA